jgi:hypothetical protein
MAVLSTSAQVLGSTATPVMGLQSSIIKTTLIHVLSYGLLPLNINTGSSTKYYWS